MNIFTPVICFKLIFIIWNVVCSPTILGPTEFYPDLDAEDLNTAFTATKTYEETIREILSSRNCTQRKAIKESYEKKFKVNISDHIKHLKNKAHRNLVTAIFYCEEEILALALYRAMRGRAWHKGGYDNNSAGVTRPFVLSTESRAIHEKFELFYEKEFHRSILDEASRLYGDFESVCIEMATRKRQDKEIFGDMSVAEYALKLSESVNKWENGRQLLDHCLMELPLKKIRDIMEEYRKGKRKEELRHTIVKTHHLSGEKRIVYKSLAQFVKNPLDYYVRLLHDAVKGKHLGKQALTLVILYRSEIDLVEVESHFQQVYPKFHTLREKIKKNGPFEMLLKSFLTLTSDEQKKKDDLIRKRLENQRSRLKTTTL